MKNIHFKHFTAGIGYALLLVLLWMSAVFFKERLLAFDPPFFSFILIQDEWFSVVLGRWGTIFSQILPLLALKADAPLEIVLQLYSSNFILIYLLIFWLLLKTNRSPIYAFTFVLYLVLGFRDTFYYPTAELYIGAPLCLFIPGILQSSHKWLAKDAVKHGLALLLFVFASYFHQLTFFPFLFVIWLGSSNTFWKEKNRLILSALFILWFIFRVKFLTSSEYEAEKIPGLRVMLGQINHFFELPSWEYFKLVIRHKIGWIFFLPILPGLGLLIKKKYFELLWFGAFTFGFWIFIILFFSQGESAIMYENYYTVFGLLIGLPLASFLYATFHVNGLFKWGTGAFTLVVLSICLSGIWDAHYNFSERNKYVARIVNYQKQLGYSKAIVDQKSTDPNLMGSNWADAFSSILLSALNTKEDAYTFYVTPEPDVFYQQVKHDGGAFLAAHFEPIWWRVEHLAPDYYSLKWNTYQLLNSSQPDSLHQDLYTPLISLECPKRLEVKKQIGKPASAYVHMRNWSGEKLPSLPTDTKSITMSYHLYDTLGNLLTWDGVRTPLEVDLWPGKSFLQRVILSDHIEAGTYDIGFQLVDENVQWMGKEFRTRLVLEN